MSAKNGKVLRFEARALAASDTTETVYIVDDDADTRDVLARLVATIGLRSETYPDGDSFLAASADRPGCVLLDVRMPGKSGLDVQAILVERGDPRPVILMTAYADVGTAIRAMHAGALNFVEKPFSSQDLLETIRRAIDLDHRRRARLEARRAIASRHASLSPREHQVLRLLLEGKGNREIAAALDLSPRTVETHRDRVMVKMQARSFAELIRFALLLEPKQAGERAASAGEATDDPSEEPLLRRRRWSQSDDPDLVFRAAATARGVTSRNG